MADQGQDNAYDRIVKYTGLFGGVQGLVVLISVVRTKLVSVLLGTTGFGINESFNRSINLVKSTTDLGIPFSAVRNISEYMEAGKSDELARSVLVTRSWALLTAVLGMALCVLLSAFFSWWAFEGDRGYTLSFILLSPAVLFSAINGGEMAILKGARLLRQIAMSQLLTVAVTFCISIPLFFWLGLRGLVPSLVLVSLASMTVTCAYSFRAFPYRVRPFSKDVLSDGVGMIRLGVWFTITSFLGSGAFAVVANWLMKNGNAETTGIYSAGYLLVSYLGMFVFSAMESDYFPRLSSVNADNAKVSEMVNSQAEVALLLMSPMVVAFMVFLGWIVSIFLSAKFADAVPMAQFAVLSLVFKSMTQPMSYISLAKGDSRTFLLQEALYDVFFVAAVILAYKWGGVRMTGLALAAASVFDILAVRAITGARYGFRFSRQALKVLSMQIPVIAMTLAAVTCLDGLWRWVAGIALLAVSVWISIRELGRQSDFLARLRGKIKNRLGR